MPHRDYCLGKAEDCEDAAAEMVDEDERVEWLTMAAEWRKAAEMDGPGPTIH